MVNSLYTDLTMVNESIYNNMITAMSNNVLSEVSGIPYYNLPDIKTESFIEEDIKRLERLEYLFESLTFDTLIEKASSVNPIGLHYEGYITCKSTEEVHSYFEDILKDMNGSIVSAVKENCDDCKGILGNYDPFIKTITGINFANTIGASKEASDHICFIKEERHAITREDINEAISIIKKCSDKAAELKKDAKKTHSKVKAKLNSVSDEIKHGADKLRGIRDKKKSKKVTQEATVAVCYHEMTDLVYHAEIVQLENQILESVKQSYIILAMAANHDPRALKESKYYTELARDVASNLFNNVVEDVYTEGFIKKIREIIKQRNVSKSKKKKSDKKSTSKSKEEYTPTPFTKKTVTSKSQMDGFYKNNDFTIEVTNGTDEELQILANILRYHFDINTPVEIYLISTKDFNKVYDLHNENAYANKNESGETLYITVIPLKTLKNSKDTVAAKGAIQARYFNDVVDNNEYREYISGRHEKTPQIQWIIDRVGDRD